MSQGSMRCDANVSIRKFGEKEYGNRTEIKNINSFKFVEKAINYEIQRQIEIIENGEKIHQETRLYDAAKNETRSMRSKEHANDYRYFPEPDLIPLNISKEQIEEIRSALPELPEEKRIRFVNDYGVSEYESKNLNSSRELSIFFEKIAQKISSPKNAAKWILGDFTALLNKNNTFIEESKISSDKMIELLKKLEDGALSGPGAKKILELLWETEKSVNELIASEGLDQVQDEEDIVKLIATVIKENPKQLEQFQNGKDKLFGFFVGQVMKASKGNADPKIVNEVLKKKLSQ
jgi:aspartyl-tRNA(Asn)/glutamyl-tRNA(Gln) amidotransferase subunit B